MLKIIIYLITLSITLNKSFYNVNNITILQQTEWGWGGTENLINWPE